MQSQSTLRKPRQNGWLALFSAMLMACGPSQPTTTPPPADTTPPGVPGGLSAQAGDRMVNLSWAANTEADLKRYVVQYGTSASNLVTSRSVDKPQVTLQVADLSNDTPYYFAVKAEDTSGNISALSTTVSATPKGTTTPPPTDTTPPGVPAGLRAEAGDQSVKLTWTANTETDLQGYVVQYGTAQGQLIQSVNVGKGQQTTTLAGLVNGTTYLFAIRALDSAGNTSALSGTVSATPRGDTPPPPQDLPPAMPQGFQVTAAANDQPGKLVATWSPNTEPDLKGYNLYFTQRRSEVTQSVFIERKQTAYTLTGLQPGTQYDLYLEAVDQAGGKSPRASASATTRAVQQIGIVSSSPQNAARGLPRNTTMSINFDTDMDKASVEGAFKLTINSVQRGATFVWTGLRTATITPAVALAYGDQARWSVNSSAKSKSGDPLNSQFESEFKVINLVTKVLPPVPAQTGIVAKVKIPSGSTLSKTTKTTQLIIGDDYDAGNKSAYRSFIGFDFSELPDDIQKFVSVNLYVTYDGFKGDVFNKLGHVELHRVKYGSALENSTWDTPRLDCVSFECYRGSPNAPSVFDVQDMFESDWTQRNLHGKVSQFSLHMVKDTNNDNNDEYVKYSSPSLTISYEYP